MMDPTAAPGGWDQRTSPASLPQELSSWGSAGKRQRRHRHRRCWAGVAAVSSPLLRPFLVVLLLFLLLSPGSTDSTTASSSSSSSSPPRRHRSSFHTSNHAVIVSSSRYWFNYRHAVNALSMYHILRDNGIPDDNIVLMLADEYAINARNPLPNQLLSNGVKNGRNLFANTTIDYRGDDVRVEQFVKVLEGRSEQGGEPRSSQYSYSRRSTPVLHTDAESNILIYLTGHGGDQFFKFQDSEEILATQLASILQRMHDANKYHRILLMADTCQAYTLGDQITAPRVTILGSSMKGESSYAHHTDDDLGLSVIERYTHSLIQFLQIQQQTLGPKYLHQLTLQQGLIDPHPFESQRAHVGFRSTDDNNDNDELGVRHSLLLSDFFAQVVVEEESPGNNTPPPQMTRLLYPALDGTVNTATPAHVRWNATASSVRQGECRFERPESRDVRSSSPRHARPLPSPRRFWWWWWWWWRPPHALEPTDGAFVGLLVGMATLTLVWMQAPVGTVTAAVVSG